MTSTAKRRWSRELETEVDGIAFDSTGPVLLHGYDPPAGGKWLDDVIPGKLGAFDRNTGERLWIAPCEVGYGRGFGAGIGQQGQVLVLGPSQGGHRMVRMRVADGELLDAADIDSFDDAIVRPEVVVCANARSVWGVDTATLREKWRYSREGERYHGLSASGDSIYVVVSNNESGKYGAVRLIASDGAFDGYALDPRMPSIHDIGATGGVVVLVTCELEFLLDPDDRMDFMMQLASHPDEGARDTLSLVALRSDAPPGDPPLWYRILETKPIDDLPEVSITADSGKLYVERRAHLEAIDALTGRTLGDWTVPGLDEKIAWSVVDGAGLLAEETRVSIFELPA
ncbi:MAG: PQQ-binding-like beta-propeller repeat protein [Planctomycetota bacterium]